MNPANRTPIGEFLVIHALVSCVDQEVALGWDEQLECTPRRALGPLTPRVEAGEIHRSHGVCRF
jgi:hypothetical protein